VSGLRAGLTVEQEPYFDDMARLTMPVGFIYGSKDFITPSTAYAVRPTLQVPNEIHIIDGGAHHAYATHADEFSHAVLRCAQLSMSGAVAGAPLV
jgi:pimeloyl-ACP methyl ester carboxylesterase